jgi:hypothetical protein
MDNLHGSWQQKSDNVKILWEIWLFVKEKGQPEELRYNLLPAQNKYGETALLVAA